VGGPKRGAVLETVERGGGRRGSKKKPSVTALRTSATRTKGGVEHGKTSAFFHANGIPKRGKHLAWRGMGYKTERNRNKGKKVLNASVHPTKRMRRRIQKGRKARRDSL